MNEIVALHRYPVKSMAGEPLDHVTLTERGLPGDRAWAVRDEVRGGIRGAKRFPELMRCSARYAEPPAAEGSSPAEVTLPDGSRFTTGDDALVDALTTLLGSDVTFWPLVPASALDHYRRGAPLLDDMEQELRRLFARTPEEPLPDLSAFPAELMQFESPPGTYFDAFPLLIVSRQSLGYLADRGNGSRFDVRRFRPNLVVDLPDSDEPFPELAWNGQRIAIGDVRLTVEMACPRCVMTTHPFDDLPKDPSIMRTLVREAGGNLGVYASVTVPGTVHVGDAVALA